MTVDTAGPGETPPTEATPTGAQPNSTRVKGRR